MIRWTRGYGVGTAGGWNGDAGDYQILVRPGAGRAWHWHIINITGGRGAVGATTSAASAKRDAAASLGRLKTYGHGRSKVAGRMRTSLTQERARRIFDAKHQPRTPVTRQRFSFVTQRKARRRPLDRESREYYEQRYSDIEYGIAAKKEDITFLLAELDSDVYDQGRKVDYRHALKGRKAFTPTGRRITGRPELAYDTAEREARARLREKKAELRSLRDEQQEIRDVMRHGERPGHYRRRLATTRSRRR